MRLSADVVINFVDVSSEQGDQLRKNIEESPLIFPKGNAFATTVTRSYDQKSFPTEYLNIVHSGDLVFIQVCILNAGLELKFKFDCEI